MKKLSLISVLILTIVSTSWSTETVKSGAAGGENPGMAAFRELQAGNKRFYDGRAKHPKADAGTRRELASGQKPNAIVLSCSDSRVPPELIFDQGLGQIFTVRVAGNVATYDTIASIEYAYEHLGAKLILAMGHDSCGAIKATLTTPKGTSAGSQSLDMLVGAIRPGVESFRGIASDDKTLHGPVKANVSHQVQALLKRSKIIRNAVSRNDLMIAQGVYSLETGKVEFWEPQQQ